MGSTLLFMCGLGVVTYKLLKKRDKENDMILFWLIISMDIVILIKSIEVIFVPLFRKEVMKPGIKYLCDWCCRVPEFEQKDAESFEPLPSQE